GEGSGSAKPYVHEDQPNIRANTIKGREAGENILLSVFSSTTTTKKKKRKTKTMKKKKTTKKIHEASRRRCGLSAERWISDHLRPSLGLVCVAAPPLRRWTFGTSAQQV